MSLDFTGFEIFDHLDLQLKFVFTKFYCLSIPTQTAHAFLRKAQQVPWIDWPVFHIDWRSTPLGFRKTMQPLFDWHSRTFDLLIQPVSKENITWESVLI